MKQILPLFLFFCSNFCFSQNAISYNANWKKGKVFRYKITDKVKVFSDDILQESYENGSNITFIVLDSTKNGYIMECTETFEKSTLEFIKELDLEEAFGNDKMTLTIRYNTDALGEIDSII